MLLNSQLILFLLSGMEGGPVFGERAELIGIVSRPLRQRVGGAEIQVSLYFAQISVSGS